MEKTILKELEEYKQITEVITEKVKAFVTNKDIELATRWKIFINSDLGEYLYDIPYFQDQYIFNDMIESYTDGRSSEICYVDNIIDNLLENYEYENEEFLESLEPTLTEEEIKGLRHDYITYSRAEIQEFTEALLSRFIKSFSLYY